MITTAFFKNFQAHSKLRIDFDAVTTVVGATDTGKSSFIRALVWWATNKPGGTDFIRDGEKECGVKIEVDGHTVVRGRGKSNTYALDGEEFVSFGATVPDTVQDVIRIESINIQQQHDAPFWLSLSDGEVAKRINDIVDLGIVDKVLSISKNRLTKEKSRLGYLQESVAELVAKEEAVEWVGVAARAWGKLTDRRIAAEDSRVHLESCSEVVADYVEAGVINVELHSKMLQLVEVGKMSAAVVKSCEAIETLAEEIKEHDSLDLETVEIRDLDTIDVSRLLTHIHDLEQDILSYGELDLVPIELVEVDWERVRNLEFDMDQLSGDIAKWLYLAEDREESETELEEAEAELALVKVCPLCGK